MLTLVFLQKDISFLTSAKATSYGVVTIMAPSFSLVLMYYTMDICSSDVPGGVSIIKKSRFSHITSVRNFLINPFFLGPLQITASSGLFNKKPIDITAKLSSQYTGVQPSLL